jgi:hypothetical protein
MRSFCVALYAACFLSPHYAHASAWTQAEGNGQIILNGWYYATDSFYNNSGTETNQDTYRKYELNPYIEYGLTDGVTIGANLSLQRASQDVAGGTRTNYGIGDTELFARFRLWEEYGFIISAEPLIKLPSPESSDETPVLGGDNPDAGLSIAAGYGFSLLGYHHYADVSAGYRYRFGDPENQLRYSATVGVTVAPKWVIMPQAFMTQRTNDPLAATFTQSSGDDFDLTKLQLSAVYKYSDDMSLQFGGFSHVDGKNTGAGDGALLAVWKKF